jgi:hypothetical protein
MTILQLVVHVLYAGHLFVILLFFFISASGSLKDAKRALTVFVSTLA